MEKPDSWRSWVAMFVVVGLVVLALPITVLTGRIAWWYCFGGPPLDMDAPHGGKVVAHIDVLGSHPPEIARIRITDTATGATVWDAKPTSPVSECWNRCWNLTLRTGENQASFAAGRQQFISQVPAGPTFSLRAGTQYLFEVWDRKGRVERDRFTL
jgi:hypothetical protein